MMIDFRQNLALLLDHVLLEFLLARLFRVFFRHFQGHLAEDYLGAMDLL